MLTGNYQWWKGIVGDMNSLFKVFTILTPKDINQCYILGILMIIGAFGEAVGIGAMFPFIAIMGQEDWLLRHDDIALVVSSFGVTTHTQFIIFCSGLLIFFYIVKNLFLAWQVRKQLEFSLGSQASYAEQLYAIYLQKPYLYHLNHNTATLLRNTYEGPSRTFTEILSPTLGFLTELVTALIIWGMLAVVDPQGFLPDVTSFYINRHAVSN